MLFLQLLARDIEWFAWHGASHEPRWLVCRVVPLMHRPTLHDVVLQVRRKYPISAYLCARLKRRQWVGERVRRKIATYSWVQSHCFTSIEFMINLSHYANGEINRDSAMHETGLSWSQIYDDQIGSGRGRYNAWSTMTGGTGFGLVRRNVDFILQDSGNGSNGVRSCKTRFLGDEFRGCAVVDAFAGAIVRSDVAFAWPEPGNGGVGVVRCHG